MNSPQAVLCNRLSKDYGLGNGLFDLDLEILEGEVFGLVGPNGAGKSTFIKLLMDLIRPTSGSATILGKDSRKDSLELKRCIGYLPGELMQFPSVTSGYILNLLLNMRGISDRTQLFELSERLNLDLDRKYQDLSHGNRQKVGLIQSMMHSPNLLILDEPTLGLDPFIQREFKSIIAEYVSTGRTVILSSHVMSEVESICSRIGLINRGRVLRVGSLPELRSSRMHKLTVIFNGLVPKAEELNRAGAEEIEVVGQCLTFSKRGEIDQVMKILSSYTIVELDSRELSLEEVFFSEVEG